MWWSRQDFPLIPDTDLEARWLDGAVVSRADSGSINWCVPAPRSYVRGAVYTQDGDIVESSQRAGGTGGDLVLTVNPQHLTAEELKEAANHSVRGSWLYAGTWMHGFGHFIVETLPTLWPLLPDRGEVGVRGVVAHRFTSRRRHRWQEDLVRPLVGDRDIHVVDATPATYERLLVPSRPYRYEAAISPRAAEVWDHIARNVAPAPAPHRSRVYLSRTRFIDSLPEDAPARARAYSNASAVDEQFRQWGFTVVFPEDLPVVDQIALVRDAEIVAGPSGSALHLAAFMRTGRVIELGDSRSTTDFVATQRAIAAVKEQVVVHVPFQADARGGFDIGNLGDVVGALID